MVPLSTLFWTSAKPIIKFVILGGCGALMAWHGMLSPAGSKVISGLILNYTLPALLFAKMVSCVSLDNVQELGLVALVAMLYIAIGAVFGVLIQKIGRVPKRLYRGIIAASMFTNFGDLPISIILAVSDHPPFLVGDGARGTAYSSVFISVFYLFLFPLGGYKLIRYDHVKEAKRLQSLNPATSSDDNEGSIDSSSTITRSTSRDEINNESLSPEPNIRSHSYLQEQPNGMEAGQQESKVTKRVSDIFHHQPHKPSPLAYSSNSPTSTIISIECSFDTDDDTRNTDEMHHHSGPESPQSTPSHRNLSPATWHRERSHTSASTATTITPDYVHGKEMQKPKVDYYQTQDSSSPSSSLSSSSSSSSSSCSVSPSTLISHSPFSSPDAIESAMPLPKVPPQLDRTFTSHSKGAKFWRLFHGTREYLTPPTLGLLLGLLVALTPLRRLFITTSTTPASPDELPPLSFILEITLMLGGCCVPLGLTVLGASLSRLKPGRMRPLVPALTLLSLSKMVLSPLIGIYVVQVLVRHYYGLVATNHMLQFTLMLMSGSPTSIICFVLAQVWDRRTQNAGSEMAALIAVQYAVATVLVTVQSACMMYFLF